MAKTHSPWTHCRTNLNPSFFVMPLCKRIWIKAENTGRVGKNHRETTPGSQEEILQGGADTPEGAAEPTPGQRERKEQLKLRQDSWRAKKISWKISNSTFPVCTWINYWQSIHRSQNWGPIQSSNTDSLGTTRKHDKDWSIKKKKKNNKEYYKGAKPQNVLTRRGIKPSGKLIKTESN